ncbi:MAG: BCCT family transporter [Eubacterium sp.]
MNRQKTHKGILSKVNGWVLFPSGGLLVLFVLIACIAPAGFAKGADAALNFVLKNFTWFISVAAFAMVIFCLWAGFSKVGKIRLGGPNAKPTMNKFVWFAIALTSGIAVGINYYGVYEPINFVYNPPAFLGVEPMSSGAILGALKYTFLHWCLHPYAIYTTAGLCVVFLIYNAKKDYRVCTALYPLLGDKIYGGVGNAIDSLVIFAIIGGIATSLGFATLQIARGLDIIMGFESSMMNWLIIMALITVFYVASSISGLHKGITYVSNINTILYFFVLIFSFIVVDPMGITELTITAIGQYMSEFINLSLFLDPIERTGWVGANNIFFITWWMVFAPLIGLFLVKLAYGRTIREFVVVNLIAPVIFSFVWFGVFGGGSMLLEKFQGTNIGTAIEQIGSDMALYAFFNELPWSGIMNVVALVIVVLSFVTLAESMTLSISAMTLKQFKEETGEASPPKSINIFWGLMMAVTAYVLLIAGGTGALQTSVIVCGLPITLLMVFMMAAFYKSMKHLDQFDVYIKEDPEAYAEKK